MKKYKLYPHGSNWIFNLAMKLFKCEDLDINNWYEVKFHICKKDNKSGYIDKISVRTTSPLDETTAIDIDNNLNTQLLFRTEKIEIGENFLFVIEKYNGVDR